MGSVDGHNSTSVAYKTRATSHIWNRRADWGGSNWGSGQAGSREEWWETVTNFGQYEGKSEVANGKIPDTDPASQWTPRYDCHYEVFSYADVDCGEGIGCSTAPGEGVGGGDDNSGAGGILGAKTVKVPSSRTGIRLVNPSRADR